MANYDNLDSLFTGIADAIRSKTGGTDPIVADNFPAAIAAIESGGVNSVAEDELIMRTIKTYSNSKVTTVNTCAFYRCINLTTVNFPVCTSIGSSAFYRCSSLRSISFPACTYIDISAFHDCSSLTSANFPLCTSISSSAFYGCSSLRSISFPACTSIASAAF